MRLTKGYTVFWNSDLQKYFSNSPQEFALFFYLVANVHYEDIPFQTWITGKPKGCPPYKQKWEILRGTYMGSKTQIKDFWRLDVRTQKRLLTNLSEKGLIEILLEDPALIIKIMNYEHMTWAGENDKRPPVELHTPPVELHRGSVILHEVDTKSVEKKHRSDAKLQTMSSLSETESKKGEGEAPTAETPPPLKIQEKGNGEGIGEGKPIEDRKMGDSDEVNRLVDRWYVRSKEIAKIELTRSQILFSVNGMLKMYSIEQNHEILDYLKTANTAAALKFIQPKFYNSDFFEHPILIVKIYQDMQKAKKGNPIEIKQKGEDAAAALKIKNDAKCEEYKAKTHPATNIIKLPKPEGSTLKEAVAFQEALLQKDSKC